MTDSSSDTTEVVIENTADVTSEPSTEKQDEGVVSLDAMVKTALGEQEAAPASDEPDSKESASDTSEGDEISDEEKKHFSERAQRRFRELVEQRRSVEGERNQVRQELEAIKPKADRMDQLLGYMTANKVEPEHLDNALGLTALINGGKYEQALPVLENLVEQVRKAAGLVLPPDLQQQVGLGYITEAHAKELHKAKLTVQRTEQQTVRERERAMQERQQREVQGVVTQAASTADTWSKEQATSDPDWNLKRDLVTERVENLIGKRVREQGQAGYPRTQKDVRDLLDTAKKDVEQTIKRFRPAPKPIDPPVTGNNASPRSKAAPASLLEAVNAALGASA
jgi:hypothetical protein